MVRRIDPLIDDEFDRLFEHFEHTAFRLETLQHYTVPSEEKLLYSFLSGDPKPAELDQRYAWWHQLIAEAVSNGKRMERVHVVVEPLSDYMRFELLWGYLGNVTAGERIGVIPVEGDKWPRELPGYGHDYWLLDSRILAALHYDHEGRFVAVDLIDNPAQIVQANAWRDAALHRSISCEQYISRHSSLRMARHDVEKTPN
jgi:hypothetical protein